MRIRGWLQIRRVVVAAVIAGLATIGGWLMFKPVPHSEFSARLGQAESSLADIPEISVPGPPSMSSQPTGSGKVKRCRERGAAAADVYKPWFAFSTSDPMLNDLARKLLLRPAPTDRAVGTYLLMHAAIANAAMDFEARNPGWFENEESRTQFHQIEAQAGSAHREELAQLAATGDNPDVYALGFYACSLYEPVTDSRCSQLSAEQWARLEPDNAIPWFYVADSAVKRGDLAGRDEAMFRASIARSSNLRRSAFSELFQSAELQAQPLEIQASLDLHVLYLNMTKPPYEPAWRYCSGDAVDDLYRRQICTGLARVMTERSDTLSTMSIGIGLAERSGWPRDQLEALRDRRDAIYQIRSTQSGGDLQSCELVRSIQSWASDGIRVGELAAYERAIAASGQTEAELAQRLRAEQTKSKGSTEAQ